MARPSLSLARGAVLSRFAPITRGFPIFPSPNAGPDVRSFLGLFMGKSVCVSRMYAQCHSPRLKCKEKNKMLPDPFASAPLRT